VHAAILKINQALDEEAPAADLLKLLKSPAAALNKVVAASSERYRDTLIAAKARLLQLPGAPALQ
jgi:hypothetical protein